MENKYIERGAHAVLYILFLKRETKSCRFPFFFMNDADTLSFSVQERGTYLKYFC